MYVSWWKDSYNLGIEYFDNQHRKIINMLNSLYEPDSDSKTVVSVLGDMVEYVNKHLADEEIFFKCINYPDAARHKKVHDQFREHVRDNLKKYINDPGLDRKIEIMRFLIKWLLTHISQEDKGYAEYYRQMSDDRKKEAGRFLQQPDI